jgi:putative copper resistance protein D
VEAASLIFARFVATTALLLLAGLPLHAITFGALQPMPAAKRITLAVLAIVAAVASIWWALEAVAAMAGMTLATLDQETFAVVLAATPLGGVMEWRLTVLAAVLFAMILPLRAMRCSVAALAGATALATMAWTGHAGASEGSIGALHRASDIVHLLAAATWLGALAGFIVAAFGKNDVACAKQLAAFARTGSVIVALLLLTGIVNTIAITGWPLPWGSQWGWLLAIKLGLFAAMLCLAAINRWKITPALERCEIKASAQLRRSVLLEFAFGISVVGIVAWLGVLDSAA